MSDDWSLEQIEEYQNRVWNAAIEAAAEKAYHVCKNDIYVKQVGLEKNCAAEIRKLKK